VNLQILVELSVDCNDNKDKETFFCDVVLINFQCFSQCCAIQKLCISTLKYVLFRENITQQRKEQRKLKTINT
jgi:hypothetical protein